ncbi:hypothetical protein BH11GEM1_BH11GEM1_35140 [soil metagenome]
MLHRLLRQRNSVLSGALLCALGTTACDPRLAAPSRPVAAAGPERTLLAALAPDSDATMGALSAIARHISAAMQDSAVRVHVKMALMQSTSAVGIDLQSCDKDPAITELFASGERFGAGAAPTLCSFAKGRVGLVLYMDRDRLRNWSPSVSPVVTAIANPDQPIAKSFHGYRSPVRTIDVPSDGSLQGPLLVVLPYQHPSRHAPNLALPPSQAIKRSVP